MSRNILIFPNWENVYKRNVEIYKDLDTLIKEEGVTIKGDSEKETVLGTLFFAKWKTIKTVMKYRERPIILSVGESPMSEYTINTQIAKKVLRYIDYIITWDSGLADNVRVFKYNLGYDFKHNTQNWGNEDFDKKKLLTLICGDLHTRYPNELYSERKRIIDYFEETENIEFDFYGRYWDLRKRKYKNYKGAPKSKHEVYSKYRFAICFENFKEADGYVSEKIIDCFMEGIVPVYYGALDIGDYVPENCFIRYDQFSNIEEMISYLRNVSEAEYNEYLNNIGKYINTQLKEEFGMKQQATTIAGLAKLPKVVHKNCFGYLFGLISLCMHQEYKIIRYGYFNIKTIKRKLLILMKRILNKR